MYVTLYNIGIFNTLDTLSCINESLVDVFMQFITKKSKTFSKIVFANKKMQNS